MRRTVPIATAFCFFIGLVVGHASDRPHVSVGQVLAKPTMTPSTEAAKTHCGPGEKVVFSCTMQKSAKVLSLCTSKQIDEKNGYVQYRFGLPGKIELEFPTERKDTQAAFGYTRYTRPLVTYLALRFEINGVKYSIHQESNAEEKPPVNLSYVNVQTTAPPNETASTVEMKCRAPVIGSLMLLEDVVPRSEGTDVLAP